MIQQQLRNHGRASGKFAASMDQAAEAMSGLVEQLRPLAHLLNCVVCSHPDRWHSFCYEGNLIHRRSLGEDT